MKKELEGVPEDVVEGFEKGTGDNEGKLRFTFKYPDLFPTLKFAVNAETRQKVFIENENKVGPLPHTRNAADSAVQCECSALQGSHHP